MKYFLLVCCLLGQIAVKAQSFYIYRDTVDNFSIGVPETWKYQATPDSPSLKITGVNVSSMAEKRVPDNFNVAIFRHPGLNVDSALLLLQKMTKGNRLQAVKDTGTYWVNGEKMRWFEDLHGMPNLNDTLCGSYFVVYRKDLVYLITGIARRSRFEQSRELYHQIAQSFQLLKPVGQEVLKLAFPPAEKWRKVSGSAMPDGKESEYLRAGQTKDNWTSRVNLIESLIPDTGGVEDILEIFKEEIKGVHRDVVFTTLSKDNSYILLKTVAGGKDAECSLIYVLRGQTRLHVGMITFKRAVLPEDVVTKWSEIFRKGKLVME